MYSLVKNCIIKSSISLILFLFAVIFNQNSCFGAYLSDKEVLDLKNEAFALYQTGSKDAALELIKQIPQSKRDDDVYIVLANILEDTSTRGDAIDTLNRVLVVSPKNYKAYYNIGCILMKKKCFDLAEVNFKTSIKCNKKFAYSYYNLASCDIARKDYKKAKKNLLKAISIKGDEKEFYVNLAYCYRMLGNTKTAQKILDRLNSVSQT